MLPRFYAPSMEPARRLASLPEDEALHLTRVLRMGAGDEIAVFDGRGHEYHARVASAGRADVQIELLEPIAPAPEARVPITLVQAILKGDKMDDVVRDATMMGAAAIDPIVTARTIGRSHAVESGNAAERWLRVAVSSAKQCRRATLPAIAPALTLEEWLANYSAGMKLILVEPSAAGKKVESLHFLELHAPAYLALLVGPEGGWTPEERARAEAAGCVPVTLGGLTLRADAVPTVALAAVRYAMNDL